MVSDGQRDLIMIIIMSLANQMVSLDRPDYDYDFNELFFKSDGRFGET